MSGTVENYMSRELIRVTPDTSGSAGLKPAM